MTRHLDRSDERPSPDREEGVAMGRVAEDHTLWRSRQEALEGLASTLGLVLTGRLINDPEEEIRSAEVIRDVRARVAPDPRPPVRKPSGEQR